MNTFEPGDSVAVPVALQPGAFPGEYLVTIDTRSGAISGFVRDQDIAESDKSIQAVVVEANSLSVSVRLSGSYFTTNGLAEFASDWARQNVKVIA